MTDLELLAWGAGIWVSVCFACWLILRRQTPLVLIALALLWAVPDVQASPLSAAERYLGMHEGRNNKALRSILGVNPSRTPWCGAFVAHAVKRAGMRPPAGALKATSWKSWGRKASSARPGDIAVIRTRRGHHVTIVKKAAGRCVIGVGGNQSNMVRETRYCGVVSIRRGG